MAIDPVRLDPFQTIVGVSWASGDIVTLIFRHAKSDPNITSANSKRTSVQLLVPASSQVVGEVERSDPPSAISGSGVGLPTTTELQNHYIWFGGSPLLDLELTLTDETYFINLTKLREDFSTEESPLTEVRIRLSIQRIEGVEGPIDLLCRGYRTLTFTLDPPPFPPTFGSPGPEIASLTADASVDVAEGGPLEPVGELVIDLTDLTAGFVL